MLMEDTSQLHGSREVIRIKISPHVSPNEMMMTFDSIAIPVCLAVCSRV